MDPRIRIITLGARDLPAAIRFYRDGLGWPTTAAEEDDIAFFANGGSRLALYPLERLAEDVNPEAPPPLPAPGFHGVTLAHNVRAKEAVAQVLELARRAGASVVKPAQDVFWGGHSGYFSDLDGYLWEVAWNPRGRFDEQGNLLLDGGEPA